MTERKVVDTNEENASIVYRKTNVLYNRYTFEWEAEHTPPTITKMSGNRYEKTKTIGKHTRKTKVALGKEKYVSPKLVLSSDFTNYIGQKYRPFHVELENEQGKHKGILMVIIK